MKIKINVYERDLKTVKKEIEGNTIDIPFGIIRKFMNLFDIQNIEDSAQILTIVFKSWKEVVYLLDMIFPDMTEDDWDGVNTKELIEVIKEILKYSFAEMLNIPVDEKN